MRRWGKLLNVGLFFLFVAIALVVGLYLSVFNFGLSHTADSWSAFGSFFGGLIGPGISIVTLLALLRTIDLQLEQSFHFVEDGRHARLAEYKTSQLQLLDQQILMFERMIDRYEQEGDRIFSLNISPAAKEERLSTIDGNIQTTEVATGKLIKLSIDISLCQFDTVEQLRNKVSKELKLIHPFFSNIP